MSLIEHGQRKFQRAKTLISSGDLGWHGIDAELRAHPAGELPPFLAETNEITIALSNHTDAAVGRRGNGRRQATRVEAGTIWLCPAGVIEEDILITRPLSQILHIYLPAKGAGNPSSFAGDEGARIRSIEYLAGVRDMLIGQIGLSLLEEMRFPSAGGDLLVDSLAMSLVARLAQRYGAGSPQPSAAPTTDHGLDRARLRRVVDYMVSHLEEDLSVESLAHIACLSKFHFSRMFKNTTGVPPHQYLSTLRLERAKTLLTGGDRSLADLALACKFSNQANFTRAFRRYTGLTPGEFRKMAS